MWLQLLGVNGDLEHSKDVEVETVPGGLTMSEEGEIEKIRIEISPWTYLFFQKSTCVGFCPIVTHSPAGTRLCLGHVNIRLKAEQSIPRHQRSFPVSYP